MFPSLFSTSGSTLGCTSTLRPTDQDQLYLHTHTRSSKKTVFVLEVLFIRRTKGTIPSIHLLVFIPPKNGGRVFLHSQPLDYHHYRRAVSNVLCGNGGPCERPLLIEMNWIDRAVPKQPVSSNRPPQTGGEATHSRVSIERVINRLEINIVIRMNHSDAKRVGEMLHPLSSI